MNVFEKIGINLLKGGFKLWSSTKLPKIDGKIDLSGIRENVEVIRDKWGIPHIYASNIHDALFAQGFVHAQDRLWQMEVNRRAARGKLSEFIGDEALDADRMSRTFGYERIGRQDWELFEKDQQEIIMSYCNGINAYINHRSFRLPIEFSLVKLKPHQWTPVDVMSLSKLLSAQMSWGWYDELIRAKLIEMVGPEAAAELDNTYPEGHVVTLPKGIEYGKIAEPDKLHAMEGPIFPNISGSNAWTVSGKLTDTGKPYLCNDPHLPITNPNIWYQMHIECPEVQVSGVSFAGVPLVPIGHNGKISWGITVAFTDIEDLFIEQFTDDHCETYLYKGEKRQAVIHEEKIFVKGSKEPVIEKVTTTEHGVVISDIIGHDDQKLALNSMALRPGKSIWGWYTLNRAENWDDFQDAMSYLTSPGLNIVYADVEGNIGYYNTGKMPVKTKDQASIPMPGWTGENDWDEFVPFKEMPHALNPEKGFIVTCNHKVEPEDFPHFLGDIYMNGYRAVRLEEMFQKEKKFNPADFTEMQMDFYCIPGKKFADLYDDLEMKGAYEQARKTLTTWDGVLDTESVAGTIYKVAKYHVIKRLYDKDIKDSGLVDELLGKGFHTSFGPANTFLGHNTSTLLRLINKGDESWWIRNYGGKEKLLIDGFMQAIDWLTETYGSDNRKWNWGRLHQIEMRHALSIKEPLDKIFNIGPFPIGGDTDTPLQTCTIAPGEFGGEIAAPSYRQIIDMSNFDNSKVIMPNGQSGNMASPYYADQVEDWLEGKFNPMCWSRAMVEKHRKHTMTLTSIS